MRDDFMGLYFFRLFLLILFLLGVSVTANAVRWQILDGTSRYKVSFDEDSVRLTPLGRLELWLRFVPRGETERKSAAVDFMEKRYRSHLEYYEIDCSEQTAMLGLIDIFGTSRTRIKRLQGGSQSDPILPGSLLESVTARICPVLHEESEEADEASGLEQSNDLITTNSLLTTEKKEQIENLQKKSALKDASVETWKELGNVYFDTDQPELAIKAYQHVLDLQPDNADTLNDQGAMYRQTGDFLKAVANFDKAFLLNPGNLESLYNGAYVYAFDLNNIPKALLLWQKYLDIESKSETAKQVMTLIKRYGK
jgi:tetratricopeptide (TPR) repeat protein